MFSDLTFALRALRRRPFFAASAILVLAFGIGANTAIFTIFRGILLQPLPFPEPQKLVTVWENHIERGGPDQEWTSRSTLWDWRQESHSFSGIAGYLGWQPVLAGEIPEQLTGQRVTTDFFDVLGVEAAIGRVFRPEEGEVGAPRVVMLSHALFEQRLGGDPSRLGESLELDGNPHTVVGVLAPSFTSPVGQAALWRPLPLGPAIEDRGNYYVRTIARLAEDVDTAAATADMERVMAAVASRAPEHYQGVQPKILSLHGQMTDAVRPALLVLMGAVALFLLVTCANVANLLLLRAAGRRREIAVRASLGANRRRLMTQMLVESQVLSFLGGALGILFGILGCRLLVSLAPTSTPRLAEISPDAVTVAFVLGLTLITGFVFGILPALSSARLNLVGDLRAGARQTDPRTGFARQSLVVGEIALALLLLIGAGLLSRSLWHLTQVDVGFDSEPVMTASLRLAGEAYEQREGRILFHQRYLEALEAHPEVESAAAVTILPMSGGGTDLTYFVEGTEPPPKGREPAAWYRQVSDGYFETLGIELQAGRAFDRSDFGAETPKVVAISQRFADRWFGGQDPIGRRVKLGPAESSEPWATVVAVVSDIHDRSPMMPVREDIYLALSQWGAGAVSVVARGTNGNPVAIEVLRAELLALDASLPLSNVLPLEDLAGQTLWLPRLTAQLMLAFSLASLILAAVGIYSVLAFSVLERRQEVGVRIALGARPMEILLQMLRAGLKPALLGLGIGLTASILCLRFLESLLHGIQIFDSVTLAAASSVLLITAAAASLLPAWKASRVDPTVSLRND